MKLIKIPLRVRNLIVARRGSFNKMFNKPSHLRPHTTWMSTSLREKLTPPLYNAAQAIKR